MTANEIGRYKVGDEEIVLRVPDPDDEVAVEKVNAISARMEQAEAEEDPEMVIHLMAILVGVLSGRSTEEVSEMIPEKTVHEMMKDFHEWVSHLVPVRPC